MAQIDLASMIQDGQTIMTGNVVSLTRYEIDAATKGGSLFLTKPNTGKNPNNLGDEIIRITIPFEMFDQQKAKIDAGDFTFPQRCRILCDVDMGSQQKAKLTALVIQPIFDEPKPGLKPNERLDKSTGEIVPKV